MSAAAGSSAPRRRISVDTPLARLAGVRVPLHGSVHWVTPSIINAFPLFKQALSAYEADPAPIVQTRHNGADVAVQVETSATGDIRLRAHTP